MRSVRAIILHHDPGPGAGPLERSLVEARDRLAERQRRGFELAGAVADLVTVEPGATFAGTVRAFVRSERPDGLVILGSGALPLARQADRKRFVDASRVEARFALANNRYSADAVAVACADVLLGLPDLPGDNALPRWLADRAGYRVEDLAARWRLQVDLDGPLDLLLVGDPAAIPVAAVSARLAAAKRVAADPSAELLIAGRASSATLRWLERSTASRVRALIEERGLRASSPLAGGTSGVRHRPPASILGLLLDRDGPESISRHLTGLADAAIVDSRVLLAHRLGAEERRWPTAEDRFASDLLLHDRIEDDWLRALTRAAASAPIPILLGGHSLVGPGVRLALAGRAPG